MSIFLDVTPGPTPEQLQLRRACLAAFAYKHGELTQLEMQQEMQSVLESARGVE